MGSREHTPSDTVRLDRVREVRRKVARGLYDADRVALDATVDAFLREHVARAHRDMLLGWWEREGYEGAE